MPAFSTWPALLEVLVVAIFGASVLEIAPEESSVVFKEHRTSRGGDGSGPPPTIHFEEALPPGATSEIPKDSNQCRKEKDYWICQVPAARLDLRIERPGMAPVYRWDVQVGAEAPADLGVVDFVPGGSVYGWVETATDDPSEAKLRLESMSATGWSGDPSRGRRAAFRAIEAMSDERGFFQGLAETRVEPVVVDRVEEVSVGSVFLESPIHFEAFLAPPADPYGQPWKLQLQRYVEGSNRMESVASGSATEAGLWTTTDLTRDLHRLEVRSSDGASWHVRNLEITGGPRIREFVEISVIPIEGEVVLGDEPISTTISFGTTQRKPEIRLRSNEEGYFEGFLPRDGPWPVEILFDGDDFRTQGLGEIEVEARRDSRPVWIDIDLPDTVIRGRVVRSNGEPATRAQVVGMRRGEGEKATRELLWLVEDDGSFEARGLQPGEVILLAKEGVDQSRWHAAHLAEGSEGPELALQLQNFVEIQGQVHRAGAPLAGVLLLVRPVLPGGADVPLLSPVTTGFDGTFTAKVPADSGALDVVMTAPGMTVSMLRLPGPSPAETPRILELEEASGTLRLAGDLTTLRLSHEGVTWSLGELQNYLFGWGKLTWDDEGTFTVAGMAAGSYTVCTRSSDCDEGYLPPNGELLLQANGQHSEERE